MLLFLGKRFLQLLPVLWGVATLVFFLLHFIPGDPVDIMLGEAALPVNKMNLRNKLHLNESIPKQYLLYLQSITAGDLGESLLSQKKVSSLIAERYSNTLQLAFLAVLLAIFIAIPLGVISAIYKKTFIDYSISLITLGGISIPGFWLGTLLILFFSVKLGWLPVSEKESWQSYLLPTITLGISLAAILTRITRNNLLEILNQDYIVTARSKGLKENIIYFKHALKNALIPVITIVALQLGALLAGTVVTETIFDWPGIGELLYRGIQSRDYPLVQGCVLVIAITYVLANTIADIAYTLANPKLNLE